MLRGAIDYTSPKRIGGWIYSELSPTQGRTVLAFLDGKCIGAGRVALFRQDLADAGLSDGHLGFNFDISLAEPSDVPRVIVKLEGSDLALIQQLARIERAAPTSYNRPSILREPSNIEWMRTRGWLDQTEFDFLKSLGQFGVFDFSLRRTRNAEKASGGTLMDPSTVAKQMLGLIAMQDLAISDQEVTDAAELRSSVGSTLTEPVFAILSTSSASVSVVEGSHNDKTAPEERKQDGAIDYPCGPDRLLFLDLRCSVKLNRKSEVTKFRAFYASAD